MLPITRSPRSAPSSRRHVALADFLNFADLAEVLEHLSSGLCKQLFCYLSLGYFLTFSGQGLIRYIPIFAEYIREFFLTSIEDGVSYVEPRINFLYKCVVYASLRV